MNNQSNFDAAQRTYDNQMPEDDEEHEPDFDDPDFDDYFDDCGEAELFAME